MGIRIFASILTAVTGRRVTDPTSGFRMTNRRGIELFARDYPHDYPEVEAVLMVHAHRLRSAEVPVRMRERTGGVSSINASKSVYYMVKVLLAIFVGCSAAVPPSSAARPRRCTPNPRCDGRARQRDHRHLQRGRAHAGGHREPQAPDGPDRPDHRGRQRPRPLGEGADQRRAPRRRAAQRRQRRLLAGLQPRRTDRHRRLAVLPEPRRRGRPGLRRAPARVAAEHPAAGIVTPQILFPDRARINAARTRST
jgi:hypothetical protein